MDKSLTIGVIIVYLIFIALLSWLIMITLGNFGINVAFYNCVLGILTARLSIFFLKGDITSE